MINNVCIECRECEAKPFDECKKKQDFEYYYCEKCWNKRDYHAIHLDSKRTSVREYFNSFTVHFSRSILNHQRNQFLMRQIYRE